MFVCDGMCHFSDQSSSRPLGKNACNNLFTLFFTCFVEMLIFEDFICNCVRVQQQFLETRDTSAFN